MHRMQLLVSFCLGFRINEKDNSFNWFEFVNLSLTLRKLKTILIHLKRKRHVSYTKYYEIVTVALFLLLVLLGILVNHYELNLARLSNV